MIPVQLQPEPPNFDRDVRQPGHAWLTRNDVALHAPPADASALPTYWRRTQKELWTAYSGVCAYLCIYFEWATGASSTDHFVAKSTHAGQAYEWSNFRLSCLGANRNKGRFDDVLDPFEMAAFTFELNVSSGVMAPRRHLQGEDDNVYKAAAVTIRRLDLNAPEITLMRTEHVSDYLSGQVTANYLKRKSPFVWGEMVRQGFVGAVEPA